MSQIRQGDIVAASQNLKGFDFTFGVANERNSRYRSRLRDRPAHPHELGILVDFLTAYLDTSSLKVIFGDLGGLQLYRSGISLGSIVTSRRCPNLQMISCLSLPIPLSEIQEFVRGLEQVGLDLKLALPRLLSGNWADCLDTLREGKLSACDLDGVTIIDRSLTAKAMQGAFGLASNDPVDARYSEAEKYVLGLTKNNLLRYHGPDELETTTSEEHQGVIIGVRKFMA